eukprot:TRINITY_DN64313_c0_g1_i1.p1 TRINITY_DN64313_c0_g1~~TRINITY_DN64313_c0_g1_i1.p1  ORF type:complete len:330 (+),score=51.04 TRINITY_DN64313_c0_g1_i1:33-1022(+)
MTEGTWAIQIGRFGDPAEVAFLSTVSKPVPNPGELLIKLEARPIHPNDLLFIRGEYTPESNFPTAVGGEGVGIVEASGDGASILVGTRVAFWYGKRGSFAEYIALPESDCFVVPVDLAIEHAAQVILNPLAMLGIMEEFGDVKPGDWVLQNGANSACGRFLVQYLKWKGIKSINVVRYIDEVQGLQDLGADHVICLETQTLKQEVDQITGGAGVSYAIDCVWGQEVDTMVSVLRKRGTLICHGLLGGKVASMSIFPLLLGLRCLRGFVLPVWMQEKSKAELQEMVDLVATLMIDKTITLAAETFLHHDFQNAFRHGESATKPRKGIIVN